MNEREFLIQIGLEPDSDRNREVMNQILDEVAQTLNQEFNLNIQPGNTREVLYILTELKAGLQSVRNEAGNLNNVTTTFTSLSGAVVNVNTDVREVIQSLADLEAQGRALSDQEIVGFVQRGKAFDSNGELVRDVQEFQRVVSVAVDGAIEKTTAYSTRAESVIGEIIERYKLLQRLQSQMGSAGWEEVSQQIANARDGLQRFIEAYGQVVNPQDLQDVTRRGEATINTKAYTQVLQIYEKIYQLKQQEIGADDAKLAKLKQEETELQRQANVIQSNTAMIQRQNESISQSIKQHESNLADLQGAQKQVEYQKQLEQNYKEQYKVIQQIAELESKRNTDAQVRTKQDELTELASEAANLRVIIDNEEKKAQINDKYLATTQQINQLLASRKSDDAQAKNEKELIQNLQQQLQIRKQIMALDPEKNSNEIETLKEQLEVLRSQANQLSQNTKHTQELSNAAKNYANVLSQTKSQHSDADDNAKIQEAIKLKKQLCDAELELFKIQKQHGTNSAVEEQRQQVLRLQQALNEATSAQLSNGKTVQQSATYTREANTATEQYQQTLRGLDDKYKSCTISLDKMIAKLKTTAENVIQYNLSWQAFQKIDQVIDSSIAKIHELDTAMTQIQMVNGINNSQARELMNTYADLAVQLGATTTQVAEGSVEWLRQGKSVSETTELLKASTMLSKIGMLDASEATTLLTSTLNGYKMSASEAISVVDKLSAVD